MSVEKITKKHGEFSKQKSTLFRGQNCDMREAILLDAKFEKHGIVDGKALIDVRPRAYTKLMDEMARQVAIVNLAEFPDFEQFFL